MDWRHRVIFTSIKDKVINYIDNFISSLPGTTIDYEAELGTFIVQTDTPQNVSIEKSDANKPISVLGIDPFTEEIKERFESLAEAERNGYANISLILSEEYNRSQSGGLRWFRADTFDPNNIPPLEIPNAKPVYCVERNQHFRSTIEAEEFMRTLNFQVGASKISAVLSPNSDRRHGRVYLGILPTHYRRNP